MVDFVRRAKPTTAGSGKAEVQPTDDLLRCDLFVGWAVNSGLICFCEAVYVCKMSVIYRSIFFVFFSLYSRELYTWYVFASIQSTFVCIQSTSPVVSTLRPDQEREIGGTYIRYGMYHFAAECSAAEVGVYICTREEVSKNPFSCVFFYTHKYTSTSKANARERTSLLLGGYLLG